MQRNETHATTGSRMTVRPCGGHDFEAADASHGMPARIACAQGVPMGGDLHAAPDGRAPTFLVAALEDPIGAHLDRIQSIKGRLDAKGNVQEKADDVACCDAEERKPGKDGRLPSVGSSVDVPNATWSNTMGDPERVTVRTDPDFDPSLCAVYHGRVIEIPTPRWTACDAQRFGVKPPPGTMLTVTERARTSPIWYTPGT